MMKTIMCLPFILATSPAIAGQYDQMIEQHISNHIIPFIQQPLVVDELKKQNHKHQNLTNESILKLDRQWRDELNTENYNLISQVMLNPLSLEISDSKSALGGDIICEIIIMDDKGMNAGLLSPSSDYWQGDEDKWQLPFNKDEDHLYISEVSFDSSSQCYVVQTNLAIYVPQTSEKIGVISVSYNAEKLELNASMEDSEHDE